MPDEDSDPQDILGNFGKPSETDRKRGIFTEKDREYLLGETEKTGQDERNTRYRIRQRVIQSFLDLQLLVSTYPDEELEKVLNDEEILEGWLQRQLLTLTYRMARYTSDNTNEEFEERLEDAISRELREGKINEETVEETSAEVDVELSVEKTKMDLQHVADQLVDKGNIEDIEQLDKGLRLMIPEIESSEAIDPSDWAVVDLDLHDEPIEVHPILKPRLEKAEEKNAGE